MEAKPKDPMLRMLLSDVERERLLCHGELFADLQPKRVLVLTRVI